MLLSYLCNRSSSSRTFQKCWPQAEGLPRSTTARAIEAILDNPESAPVGNQRLELLHISRGGGGEGGQGVDGEGDSL